MKRLVIFGVGQIGQVAHYYFTEDSDYEVAAFTVDAAYLDATVLQSRTCNVNHLVPQECIDFMFQLHALMV